MSPLKKRLHAEREQIQQALDLIPAQLAGKLKWTGDAVKEQRKLRDEW